MNAYFINLFSLKKDHIMDHNNLSSSTVLTTPKKSTATHIQHNICTKICSHTLVISHMFPVLSLHPLTTYTTSPLSIVSLYIYHYLPSQPFSYHTNLTTTPPPTGILLSHKPHHHHTSHRLLEHRGQ